MYLLENIKKGDDFVYKVEDRGEVIEVKTKVFAIYGNKVLLLDGHSVFAF